MMFKIIVSALSAVVIGTVVLIGGAHAALIGSGSVSMAGGWTPTKAEGNPNVANATGVHFLPAGPNNVSITPPGGQGSFASLTAGITGTIKDFTFTPFVPVSSFLIIGGFTFDLTSIHVDQQNAHFLDLSGSTNVTSSAGTDTASFIFSAQGGGQPATFSWSATAASVPEPMTLGLLGTGIFALGVLRRRRSQSA
jgi:hypothetical protein